MYQNILFDLDGTLTDPGEGITASVAYALEKMGTPEPDRSRLYRFIGPPLVDSFRQFYGFSPEECKQAAAYYRERFQDKGIFENEVFPGIAELLSKLKASGRKLIIATSKPELFARRILEHFDLLKYFDYVFGDTMEATRSNKADVIAYALEQAGIVDLKETIMVGDRLHDVIGAKKNNLPCIGVLFGYGSEEELKEAGAAYLAATVEDIWELIDHS